MSRGPTFQRQALRAAIAPGSLSLIDGNAWVRLYDGPQPPFYSLEGMETTARRG